MKSTASTSWSHFWSFQRGWLPLSAQPSRKNFTPFPSTFGSCFAQATKKLSKPTIDRLVSRKLARLVSRSHLLLAALTTCVMWCNSTYFSPDAINPPRWSEPHRSEASRIIFAPSFACSSAIAVNTSASLTARETWSLQKQSCKWEGDNNSLTSNHGRNFHSASASICLG